MQGDTCADKARDFIGKGGEQEGERTQNCSATWLAVPGLPRMGLVSGLSLAPHSDSESFLVVHASRRMDSQQGFWEAGRTYGPVSPVSF